MRKTFVTLLGLTAGILLLSSCEKTCKCDVIIDSEVKYVSEKTFHPDQYKSCKDMGSIAMKDGLEYGERCK